MFNFVTSNSSSHEKQIFSYIFCVTVKNTHFKTKMKPISRAVVSSDRLKAYCKLKTYYTSVTDKEYELSTKSKTLQKVKSRKPE